VKRSTVFTAIIAGFTIAGHGQGFQNLNFESAQNLPGNPGNGESVSVANALPDWTAYSGPAIPGNALSDILYVSNILSRQSPVELEGGTLALSGNYSAELFMNSAIGQTGMVPNNAESLDFEAEGRGAGGSLGASGLSVTLGADTLSLSAISEGADYTVYGANIPSNLDGLSEPLLFSCQGVGSGQVQLDNIEFLPTSVPEPAECALIGLGGILDSAVASRKRGRDVADGACPAVASERGPDERRRIQYPIIQ
jgi:hypothetical protein